MARRVCIFKVGKGPWLAQLAFNEQVSSDLSHLRKHVDLTYVDVDEVCQQWVIAPPPVASSQIGGSHIGRCGRGLPTVGHRAATSRRISSSRTQ